MSSTKAVKKGQSKVTTILNPGESVVVVKPGEKVLMVKPHGTYELGGDLGDVVSGDVLLDARERYWCNSAQSWVPV